MYSHEIKLHTALPCLMFVIGRFDPARSSKKDAGESRVKQHLIGIVRDG